MAIRFSYLYLIHVQRNILLTLGTVWCCIFNFTLGRANWFPMFHYRQALPSNMKVGPILAQSWLCDRDRADDCRRWPNQALLSGYYDDAQHVHHVFSNFGLISNFRKYSQNADGGKKQTFFFGGGMQVTFSSEYWNVPYCIWTMRLLYVLCYAYWKYDRSTTICFFLFYISSSWLCIHSLTGSSSVQT